LKRTAIFEAAGAGENISISQTIITNSCCTDEFKIVEINGFDE
jgi:hypothetical protein